MVGMSGPGLRSRAVREGWPTRKDADQGGREQTFTLDNLPDGANWTPDALLERVGLNPEEWRITSVKARGGHWGNPEVPSSQLRLEVTVAPLALPFRFPDPADWKPLPKPKARKKTKVHTAVVIGDHHAPHHDKTFHALFCQWLTEDQPDLIEVNGDLLDFSDISRHRPREGWNQSVNECLQGGYDILRDYREACPDSVIRLKRGNHDERLHHALIDNVKQLHKVTAPGEEVAALSLQRLLHLDHLHVEYVDEEWDRAKTRIGKRLTALHGATTSKNASDQMLSKLSGSTLQGHSHRLSLQYRTTHHTDEGPETRLAGECGCACEISDGLGYALEPNWAQGAMLVKTWPDDDFTCAPIVYLPGRLLLPDGRRFA